MEKFKYQLVVAHVTMDSWTFDSIANAIKDLNERVVVEYARMTQSFNEKTKRYTALSNLYDDNNYNRK